MLFLLHIVSVINKMLRCYGSLSLSLSLSRESSTAFTLQMSRVKSRVKNYFHCFSVYNTNIILDALYGKDS